VAPGDGGVGRLLVGNAGVDKVSFTGSTSVGREVASICGRQLKPVTLELGGESAAIILDDPGLNLDDFGEALFGATLANTGQMCFASTDPRSASALCRGGRVLHVHGAIADHR
jgi:aldehyde dehydrogenase (NAD+)